ncbi:hypothetical protein LR48_Vigan11g057200 [Vigna angularis]|uniref:Uncharacterized protein n=1 Tax=Phaseolus angularis TaxID=3914 RepID=A0A0L9VS23_PHAAN|nr:hypothetical protein LR48_Vigan11g057200 [Vigna angularis]
MGDIRITRVEQSQTKIKSVPIAVTPEGFWCCPTPVGLQKSLKPQNPLNKLKPSPPAPKSSSQKKEVSGSVHKDVLSLVNLELVTLSFFSLESRVFV